jgi:nitroreductase/ketosteroid isomerase-like protein
MYCCPPGDFVSLKQLLFLISFFVIFLVFWLPSSDAGGRRPPLSIRETFDFYVRSAQNADLEGLFSTVTDNESFFFVTGGGKLIDSRQGYYEFHQRWFGGTGWEMPVELLEVYEGEDYGYTNAIFHYMEETPEGGKYLLDSYFTLIFHKEEGKWKVVADICAPISRALTEANPEIRYSFDQIYLFDTIKNRRTVRKFKDTPVPREHLMKILDLAHYAPTAGNQQPWKFLVVQDREKLDRLRKEALRWFLDSYKSKRQADDEQLAQVREGIKESLENALSAPVYVAVLVDSEAEHPDYVISDGTLAAGYLMIAARALGYGTGFFTTFFPEEKMKQFFDIPDRYKLICFTPIGVPETWPEAPQKKNLEEVVVFDSF